jgi:hypothetical protein
MTRSRDLANLGDNAISLERQGLTQIVPTSVTVAGAGSSGSVNTNGQVTFTSSTSASINTCFSSTYDNYHIVIETTASTGAYLNLRLRSGTTDASGSNYSWGLNVVTNGGTVFGLGGSGATSSNILRPATTRNTVAFTICSPNIARETVWSGTLSYNDGATVGVGGAMGGIHAVSTAYDGFTITAASGTITGKLSVYGWRN